MTPDLVSTIIPVYNRPEMLTEAVASVLAQTWRPIEVIISDDGSTDDTPTVANALVAAHPVIVRYVRNENRGPGPAREAGRLMARGEFIQYLDSDDRLLPDKFSLQIAALRARPDCGVAYGYTRLVDANGRVLRAPFKWTGEDRETLFPGLLVDRWWCTHTPLYRRSVTDAVGPWSDLRYSQDWEYDARVGSLGTLLVNCHQYVSEHRQHDALRQTGGGKWLSPKDRIQFFASLYQHASKAGGTASSGELKHFSRWAFLSCRQVAALGDARAARELFAIAAAANEGASFDMRAFAVCARTIGWQWAAWIAEMGKRLVKRQAGRLTKAQSWMS